MLFSEAEMMTIAKPVHIQAITPISANVLRANVSICSHGTGEMPNTPMKAFMVPVWGSPGGW